MSNRVCSEVELEKRELKRKNRKANIKATAILVGIVLGGVLVIGGVASVDMKDGKMNPILTGADNIMRDVDAIVRWTDGSYKDDEDYVEGMTYSEWLAARKVQEQEISEDDWQDIGDSFDALIDRIKQGI